MPFDMPCDWKSGFVMDPTQKSRVGYLMHFEGLDMTDFLKKDIEVFTPYSAGAASYSEVTIDTTNTKLTCVGVIESFSFGGGVGDPVCISAYISAENAEQLAGKMKTTLTTTKVKKLGWWICNFDEENKVWYEEAHPMEPAIVNGQLNAPGGKDVRLSISQTPTKVAANVDINVYNLYFEVVPAASQTFNFHFATSKETKFIKNWGLKVGTKAAAAMA